MNSWKSYLSKSTCDIRVKKQDEKSSDSGFWYSEILAHMSRCQFMLYLVFILNGLNCITWIKPFHSSIHRNWFNKFKMKTDFRKIANAMQISPFIVTRNRFSLSLRVCVFVCVYVCVLVCVNVCENHLYGLEHFQSNSTSLAFVLLDIDVHFWRSNF